ncbi:MAG: sialidase family protein [Spirochaetaceae bacterium]|nr:sialidase family protein [Spirochaetaceae bacterium]
MGPIQVVGEVAVAAGPGAAVPGTAHRAWPSLERTEDGGLVVAYKVGPDHHKTDDGVVWVARSEDGGLTWPFRRPVVAEPGWEVFTHHGLTRLADGSLLLHCVRARHLGAEEAGDAGEGAFFARGAFIRSEDGGRTWLPHGPQIEMPFISATGRGFCYGKIQELAGGALIVPFYGTPADRTDELQRVLAIVRSDDGGRSWREHSFVSADPASPLRPSETDLLRLADGRLLAVVRANARKRLYRAWSEDDGLSWSELEPTPMPGQSPALLALESGAILCAYRVRTEEAFGLGCAVSRDAGATWQVQGSLYAGDSGDCAYPSMVTLPDGAVYCAFYTSPRPTADGPDSEIRGLILADPTATVPGR